MSDWHLQQQGHHHASSYYRDCSECHQRGHECPLAVCPGPQSGRICLGQHHFQFSLSALLFLYMWWKKVYVDTWGGWTRECFQEWGSYICLVIPSMFMVCIERWTFEIGNFLAGLIDVTELGAQGIIYELALVAYMVHQSLIVFN
ncbi:multidrug and toxin extrusion protein 2-like isoform X2 [Macaca mulatta]